MNKKDLWLKIANYHFDNLAPAHLWDIIVSKFGGQNPFTKAFADKLARKLNWERKFAMKAIWEYKKFVYLGIISDFSVTPSKIIDQVWHEHILFSAGYRKFCDEVIQYDFAHNPELIPIDSQISVFQNQYFNTLELYEKEFGSSPPADIWDNTKFGEKKKKKQEYAVGTPDVYTSNTDYDTDAPLIDSFPDADSSTFEFGGGDFGGAGADGGWDDGSGTDMDGSSSDGDSGSDSGSSCSSSCGGGCGGD